MAVDRQRLADLLTTRLHVPELRLSPIDVRCAWPVFKATGAGLRPLFVKLASPDAAKQTLDFLKVARECPFLPRVEIPDALGFDGFSVLCLEWKDAKTLNAEDMTPVQVESFAAGCRTLSRVLQDYPGSVEREPEDSPDLQYAALVKYAARHAWAGRLIRDLLSIPEGERSYDARKLVVIHGDLQPKNYGFDGDRFAAVFDFDAFGKGLACEDAAYAFTERARKSELTSKARRRLLENFLKVVQLSDWPMDEWQIAINHARLRIAARRLDKHPDAAFIAFDIVRRDKPLRVLAEALKGGHA